MSARLDPEAIGALGAFLDALGVASVSQGYYIDMEGVEVCTSENATVGYLTWNNDAQNYELEVQP